MKFKLGLISILLGVNAWAGGDVIGNGGDVVVCGDKVEMLDFYEAKVKGLSLDLGSKDLNYEEKIKYVLNRNRTLQPRRVEMYLGWLSTFKQEASFQKGIELQDVADSGLVVIPKGCKLEQIAIQLDDETVNNDYSRYTVNQDLWEKMDENNKAILVLHEIIYREGIQSNLGNSMSVRMMNRGFLQENPTRDLFIDLNKNFKGLFFEIDRFYAERIKNGHGPFSSSPPLVERDYYEDGKRKMVFATKRVLFSKKDNSTGKGCFYDLKQTVSIAYNLAESSIEQLGEPYRLDKNSVLYCTFYKFNKIEIKSLKGYLERDLLNENNGYAVTDIERVYGRNLELITNQKKYFLDGHIYTNSEEENVYRIIGTLVLANGEIHKGQFSYDFIKDEIFYSPGEEVNLKNDQIEFFGQKIAFDTFESTRKSFDIVYRNYRTINIHSKKGSSFQLSLKNGKILNFNIYDVGILLSEGLKEITFILARGSGSLVLIKHTLANGLSVDLNVENYSVSRDSIVASPIYDRMLVGYRKGVFKQIPVYLQKDVKYIFTAEEIKEFISGKVILRF
ncbi:MAG: hypothetical protein AB7I27_08975 [Bacteriovoracaceae bacterium]